jgi:hypothetical protein
MALRRERERFSGAVALAILHVRPDLDRIVSEKSWCDPSRVGTPEARVKAPGSVGSGMHAGRRRQGGFF